MDFFFLFNLLSQNTLLQISRFILAARDHHDHHVHVLDRRDHDGIVVRVDEVATLL